MTTNLTPEILKMFKECEKDYRRAHSPYKSYYNYYNNKYYNKKYSQKSLYPY